MSVRARRLRPSVTRQPSRRAPAAGGNYRRTRAAVILGIFILIFGVLWVINGDFTATFVMVLFRTTIEWGWAAHLLMSAIEIGPIFLTPYFKALPRKVLVLLWLLSLPFGVLDVLSSAIGVGPFFVWTGAREALAHVQNTSLAEVVAFLPEPMLFWLIVALRNVLRG